MLDKRFLGNAALTLIFGIVMFFLYNKTVMHEEENTLQERMDSLLLILNNKLRKSSDIALASSLLLSKNSNIVQCIEANDQESCLDYLLEIKSMMADNRIFRNMSVHLHTRDFKSFIRLWDYKNRTEDDLSGLRYSLKQSTENRKPIQGIEIGKYGMLERAIVPIFRNNEYLGSVETVVFPEEDTEFFKEINIDLYILVKNEYLPKIVFIQYPENRILKNYTIVNRDMNGISFIDDKEFSGTGYLKYGDRYALYTPIVDINGKEIGYYVLSWIESLAGSCKSNCSFLF
jgi:hypothetical protein